MSTSHRSKNGCWTCRLRRKKCTEDGPPCSSCQCLGIQCHGYGARPAWKDRGDKEKEEARRLRIESKKIRTMSQSSLGDQTVQEGTLELLANGNAFDLFPAGPSAASPSPTQTDLPLSFPSSQDVAAMDSMNNCLSTEPLFADDIWTNAVSNSAVQDLVTPPLTSDITTSKSEMGLMNFFSLAGTGPLGVDVSENDIFLLANFVESAFSRQYPLLGDVSTAEKSWLMCLMFRSSTFYHTSLSMSAYQLHLCECSDDYARDLAFQNYQTFRDMAIHCYDELETMPPSIYAERIICGVHLAHLEALGKNMQSCQSYLERVAQFAIAQGGLLDISVTNVFGRQHHSTTQLTVSEASFLMAQNSQPSGMELRASMFFVVTFIWNDVLSCAVERKTPCTADIYRQLFADNGFKSAWKHIAGCEAWVMSTILDVTALEIRKREEVVQGKLSIRELVTNADKIEAVVKREMGCLSSTLKLETMDESHDKTAPCHAIQTLIFSHAILIYLNTIVSGAFTGVPEIHDNIDRAAHIWRLLPSTSSASGHLAWAYCTTASLATESQRLCFRDIAANASSQDLGVGSLRHSATIVEECWKQMDMQGPERRSSPCDWKEVLKKLNLNVLFV